MSNGFHLGYHQCRELLARRLAAPAPGRIQLLAGPRQVGRTTLPRLEPLVVCGAGGLATAARAGIRAVTWQEFLLEGPPARPATREGA
jgi:hypothetical protein